MKTKENRKHHEARHEQIRTRYDDDEKDELSKWYEIKFEDARREEERLQDMVKTQHEQIRRSEYGEIKDTATKKQALLLAEGNGNHRNKLKETKREMEVERRTRQQPELNMEIEEMTMRTPGQKCSPKSSPAKPH